MKLSQLKRKVKAEENGIFLTLPRHTFEQIDFELDNFFLGLRLYVDGNPQGLKMMLESFHQLGFCKEKIDSFIMKAVKKYRANIDSKIAEELCKSEK